RFDDEHPARTQRTPEAIDEQTILVVGEIPDAREEVHGEVELSRELHVAHVLAGQAQCDAGALRRRARSLQLGLVEIHAGDGTATAGGFHPGAARTPGRGGARPPPPLSPPAPG